MHGKSEQVKHDDGGGDLCVDGVDSDVRMIDNAKKEEGYSKAEVRSEGGKYGPESEQEGRDFFNEHDTECGNERWRSSYKEPITSGTEMHQPDEDGMVDVGSKDA